MRHARSMFLWGAVVGVFAAAAARGETLGEGWGYRRALDFTPAQPLAPGLKGDNEAWAEFYANGAEKPDGADIRVTNGAQVLVPFRILQSSAKDDFFRIAFATPANGGSGPYYVYWGNEKAGAVEKPLEVQRGVFVEVSKNVGGDVRNGRSAEGLADMLAKSRPLAGFFVPEIFLGYDPLGDEGSVFFHYVSDFRIEKPMAVEFAFAVLDSGTLRIDGEPVLHEFRGGWRNKVRESKSVDLAAGWHHIEVTQINFGGGGTAGVSVVWKKPGQKDFVPMGDCFSPIAQARVGGLEKIGGGGAVIDMKVTPAAETFVPPDGYVQRYDFEAVVPSGASPKVSWDFGDGQVISGGLQQSHVYLTAGTYAVTAKQGSGGSAVSTTMRVTVKDRMYALFPTPPEDKTRGLRSILDDDDVSKLSGAAALRGMQFFKNIPDYDRTIRWGRAWLTSTDNVASDTLSDEMQDLAGMLIGRKDYAGAAEFYRLASEKRVAMEQRLVFLRDFVGVRCDYFDDATPGLAAAMDWQKRIDVTNNNQLRLLTASLVYAAIAQGDGKIARDALAQFTAHVDDRIAAYNHAQIRQGVLARNIEAYIRTKDFVSAQKLIDEWEMEFPESIWDGFTRTLRVKLYAAQGLSSVAARIAVEHARANPAGFYAAELLYRASQNFQTAGDADKAKAAMDLLTSKYPESPYARKQDVGAEKP